MTERRSNRRDEKLEAAGINRREWVAKAIALAGMHGTGARRPQGKRAAKREDEAPEAEEEDENESEA
jgi:hypothetical protein